MLDVVTALVLSAGGMFGAYQAGAWRGLADRLQPELVVGTSVGALNGWAIAGGATPDELVSVWLEDDLSLLCAPRLRQAPWKGCLDSRPLHARIRKLYDAHRPRTRIAVTATELARLRPRVFADGEITWRHLAASCAVLLGYEQIRIEGRLYTDGGLLDALPVWAAAELGATRIVAVNALPEMPSVLVRGFVGALRAVARPRPPASGRRAIDLRVVRPARALGSLRQAVFWNRTAVEEWIGRGEADARRIDLQW